MQMGTTGRAPVLVEEIGPIRDQAAGGSEAALHIDRRQLVPGRQRDDQMAMNRHQRAARHDQPAMRRTREGRDGTFNLRRIAYVEGKMLGGKADSCPMAPILTTYSGALRPMSIASCAEQSQATFRSSSRRSSSWCSTSRLRRRSASTCLCSYSSWPTR